MSTSTSESATESLVPRRAALRTIVVESAVGAALAAGCLAIGARDDVWLTGAGFHPAWLAVLVLAARYGTRGLFVALTFTCGALAATSVALGGTVDGLLIRATSSSDLSALTGAIGVAWIAMSHESRAVRLAARLEETEKARATADETLAAFQDSIAALRTRHDRIDLSLVFWRNLAARLGSETAAEAAAAALELGMVRTGATAGTVHAWDGAALHVVSRFGRESPSDSRQRGFWLDRTARAAVDRRSPTLATDVERATENDSDVAVPVLDPDDRSVIGVISFRGLRPGQLRGADLHDLGIVAQWIAPALRRSRQAHAPAPRFRAGRFEVLRP